MNNLNLRKCEYKEGKYYFHTWFQEGGQLNDNGTIDIGCVLENCCNGKIIKVYDIQNIQFTTDKN